MSGLPGGAGLNIAHECVDRHAAGSSRTHVALRFLSRGGRARDFGYDELSALTNRFANLLDGLGVVAGGRAGSLLGRELGLYVEILGTAKHRSVA